MPLQSGFAQNWLQTTEEVITGFEFYPAIESPAGKLAGADDLELTRNRRLDRPHLLLPVNRGGAPDDRHRESVFHSRPGCDRSAHGRQAPRREGARHGRRHPQRQLDGAAEQRAPLRAAAQGGHRDLRVQPHDAASENDGGRRRVVDRRHDELRQPIVRAQRREQRLRVRWPARETARGDLRRRHQRLRCDDIEEVAEAGLCSTSSHRTRSRCFRSRSKPSW